MEGADKLRVPLWTWCGLPPWDAVPECVKSWTFARDSAKALAAKALKEYHESDD